MTTKSYAVIESAGRHARGERVQPVYTTDDAAKAKARAERETRAHQAKMAAHGGSSGGYAAVRWEREPRATVLGHEADRLERI